MREFTTFTIKDEMPPRMGQQIDIPSFMLSDTTEEVKNDPDRFTFKDIIRLISLVGICWFFCFIENNVGVGLIGVTASTAALALTGGEE